jgi:uncharacterized phiE125 gp8 family phage protein
MAYLKVVTPPNIEPLTLTEVKRHLRIYEDGYNDTQKDSIAPQVVNALTTITGTEVDVLGADASVWVNVGNVAAGGLLNVTIHESDVSGSGFLAWSGGTFTQIVAAGQYSKAYTGGKRYIKVVATVTIAAVTFSSNVQILFGDPVADAEILDLITRAREEAEERTRLALAPQTLEIGIEGFPADDCIELRRGPVASVSSFDIYSDVGVKTTLTPTTQYLVDLDSVPARVVLPYAAVWPTGADYPINPIRIKYIVGYTTLPARLKSILLVHVGLLYKYRDVPIPDAERKGLDRLYNSYRVYWFEGSGYE